jgi:hypothetical protein
MTAKKSASDLVLFYKIKTRNRFREKLLGTAI